MSEEEIPRLSRDYFPPRIIRLDKLGMFKIAPMSRIQQMIYYNTLYENQSDYGPGGPIIEHLFDIDNLNFWKDYVLNRYTKDGKKKGIVVPKLPSYEEPEKLTLKLSILSFNVFEDNVLIFEDAIKEDELNVRVLPHPFSFIGINKSRMKEEGELVGVESLVILNHSVFMSWLEWCKQNKTTPAKVLNRFFNDLALEAQLKEQNKEKGAYSI